MAECVFKQIAMHPDDRANCITEANVREPITILKHSRAMAAKKFIMLREKRTSLQGDLNFLCSSICFSTKKILHFNPSLMH